MTKQIGTPTIHDNLDLEYKIPKNANVHTYATGAYHHSGNKNISNNPIIWHLPFM